jgi:hypothetical protein
MTGASPLTVLFGSYCPGPGPYLQERADVHEKKTGGGFRENNKRENMKGFVRTTNSSELYDTFTLILSYSQTTYTNFFFVWSISLVAYRLITF